MSAEIELTSVDEEEKKTDVPEDNVLAKRTAQRNTELEGWMHGGLADLPRVQVRLQDYEHVVKVPVKRTDVPTVSRSLLKGWGGTQKEDFHVLFKQSAVYPPGTMTLLLGPPGAGKSSHLKALANLGPKKKNIVSGSVLYNGVEPDKVGVTLEKLVKYVSQHDDHMALLTVRETLRYAGKFQNAGITEEELNRKVDRIINVLRLESAADTIAGNEFIRGISGGERRRLTIGEMLMGNPRILCLDEITTGLDSSTAYDIVAALKQWAQSTGGTVIANLLQPMPEVYAMFDRTVLLQDGHLVYNGPRDGGQKFIEEHAGFTCPADVDVCDFLLEYLTDPTVAASVYLDEDAAEAAAAAAAPPPGSEPAPTDGGGAGAGAGAGSGAVSPAAVMPSTASGSNLLSPAQLEVQYVQHRSTLDPAASVADPQVKFDHAQYVDANQLGWGSQVATCVSRQARVYGRDIPNLVGPWIQNGILQGLIVGSVWYQLPKEDFISTYGFMFYWFVSTAFVNMIELPIASSIKPVLYKQLDSKYHSPSAFVASSSVLHIPFMLVNLLTIFTISYWMVGLSNNLSDFLTQAAIFASLDTVMSIWFRFIVYLSPSTAIAEVFAPFTVLIFFVFSGFVIVRDKIHSWLLEFYYVSPFAYALRAAAITEFKSDSYSGPSPLNPTGGLTEGEEYLLAFDFQRGSEWVPYGIIYNFFMYFVLMVLTVFALRYVRFTSLLGTKRRRQDDLDVKVQVEPDQQAAIPFPRASIAWRGLQYSVPVKVDGKTQDKVLLTDIQGAAEPGRLVALMGVSGAGKSTLLDVLADRKTTGDVQGEIIVNGAPRSSTFKNISAYVQQQDVHLPTQTVREAVEFSAQLRLPASTKPEQRVALVDEVLTLMELAHIQNRMVGGDDLDGISAGERKRLTAAVELAANPSILFLDEPTTGLDSRSAMAVMRAIQNVAKTGRSVIATIHQPSASIVSFFTDLILLQTGGTQVFHGEMGVRAHNVVKHLESVPGVPNLPAHMNPATWMLDIVANNKADDWDATLVKLFKESSVGQASTATVTRVSTAKEGADADSEIKFSAPSLGAKFSALVKRTARQHWRDVPYTLNRWIVMLMAGVVLGVMFVNLADERDDIGGQQSMLGATMLISNFGSVILFQTSTPMYMRIRASFYRETASAFYPGYMQGVVHCVIETLSVVLLTAFIVLPTYALIKYTWEAERFFLFYGATLELNLIMNYFAIATAALFPHSAVVGIVNGLFQNCWWLFNSVFIAKDDIPKGWKWFSEITFYHRAIEPQYLALVHDTDVMVSLDRDGSIRVPEEAYAKETYDYDWDDRAVDLGILGLWMGIFVIIVATSYQWIRHVK